MPHESASAQQLVAQEPVATVRRYALKSAQPRRSLVDFDAELNEEQRAVALCAQGPTLVVAGAGSGKTRTLTYRVAHLIEEGVAPDRILLLTFTNKAAREMMARVAALCRIDGRQLAGGTFHHVAHGLLRDHVERLGYEARYPTE